MQNHHDPLKLIIHDIYKDEFTAIEKRNIKIGRNKTNDYVISNSHVSAFHSQIEVINTQVYINKLEDKKVFIKVNDFI